MEPNTCNYGCIVWTFQRWYTAARYLQVRFRRIPAEIQKIIIEVGHDYEIKLAEETQVQLDERFALMRQKGVNITRLSSKEKSRWGGNPESIPGG